ncbi:hypothetical protein COI93_20885 [Bacillus cereus]|uniref:Uncharacterized protein n=1 Tax=Bacillus cereus TaxID=1396 RepID=A0A2B0LRY4_BACCE|nr:hypothetical protein COI93_20885 [Bacillus cereus]
MQFRTKLCVSVVSTILFIIASTIFFLNNHPMKWLWLLITVSSIMQSVVIYRQYKSIHWNI